MDFKVLLVIGFGQYTLCLIIFFLFYLFPPKKINSIYGYRTGLSQKNQANWDYANKIAPKISLLCMIIGLILLLILLLVFKNSLDLENTMPLIIIYMVINLMMIIPIVEYKLSIFDKENLKNKEVKENNEF